MSEWLPEFFELPTATIRDLYSSNIVHKDVTTLVAGRDRAETRRIIDEIKRTMEKGERLSVGVSFNLNRKKLFVSMFRLL